MSVDAPAPAAPVPRRQRWLRLLLIALVALVALALLVQILLPPERALRLLLGRLEPTLGLRIEFTGDVEYRLRGTPQLVVRDVTVAAAGADAPLLQAERVLLSLPWQTIRSRGADLSITRIELDAPHVQLPALLDWLDSRPPGDGKIPPITDGVRIVRGRLDGGSWRVEDLRLDLPALHAGRAIDAQLAGTAHLQALQLPFDLHVHADRAVDARALQARGTLALLHASGRLDTTLQADGTRIDADMPGFALAPLRIAAQARWQGPDAAPVPFVLGLHGALRVGEGPYMLRFAPLGIAVRGEGVVPDVLAAGHARYGGDAVDAALEGRLAHWPQAWPPLPAPLDAADVPMPFSLHYDGPADASAPLALHLAHQQARFEGEARIAAMLAWLDDIATGSPVPPLRGQLTAERVEVAGAVLEGVEIEFDDGSAEAAP